MQIRSQKGWGLCAALHSFNGSNSNFDAYRHVLVSAELTGYFIEKFAKEKFMISKTSKKAAIILLLLTFFGVATYYILRNMSRDTAEQKLLANELRVRAGIFDLNGNLINKKNFVNYFPGVSDFCRNYFGGEVRAVNCLTFYLNISDFSWNSEDEDRLKVLLSSACRAESFCRNGSLRLVEVFLVANSASTLNPITFGNKNFHLVKKINYFVESDSWN